MGACLSADKLPDNMFIVRNIHDDHRKFPKGIIEVTHIELKYKDAQSGDEWVWPLKYLRKYGCDRDIFSFEAGRKCPGGEGLYAFSTKKAAQLFDLVARNISEGGLEAGETAVVSPQELSRLPSQSPISPPASLSPNPPPPPVTDPPSHPPPSRLLPEYTNLSFHDGQPVPITSAAAASSVTNGHMSSSPPPPPLPRDRQISTTATPSPPPTKLNYTEVALPEATKPLEVEGGETQKQRVSYSEIDIKQTDVYNREMARRRAESAHPLPDLGSSEFKIVNPSEQPLVNGGSRSRNSSRPPSATSAGAAVSGQSSSSSLTVANQRSMSEGNFSVPSSVSAAAHRGSNGFIPGHAHSQSASAVPNSQAAPPQLYQNIVMSKSNVAPPIPEVAESAHISPPPPPQLQPNYMNITPNPALSHAHSDSGRRDSEHHAAATRRTSEQQTYQNLQLGKGMASLPKISPSVPGPTGVTSPPRVSGPATALYADLVLGPATSTPKVKKEFSDGQLIGNEENRMTLNFSSGSAILNRTPAPSERSHSGHSPPPAELQLGPDRGRSSTQVLSPSQAGSVISSHDDTTVNYSTMNFRVMEGLRKTREQREEEKRLRTEEEAREEERRKREEAEQAANPGKKKKKGKKKARRNSHQ